MSESSLHKGSNKNCTIVAFKSALHAVCVSAANKAMHFHIQRDQ